MCSVYGKNYRIELASIILLEGTAQALFTHGLTFINTPACPLLEAMLSQLSIH